MGDKKYLWLSHILSKSTPSYGGSESVIIESKTSIDEGDTANTLSICTNTHLGTHIDMPKHFFEDGPSITDYHEKYWIFNYPQLINIPCEDGKLITPIDIKSEISIDTDLLLLRTGFEKYRKEKRYWETNPGLSPDLGIYLREKYPNIRAVGIDPISITSILHRESGRAAHRVLLDPHAPGKPIVIIEDMALSKISTKFNQVLVLPLRIRNSDGAPVTIMGVY